jgi:DDHD domain
LSFEDGGYRDESDSVANAYSLSDITPDTLPSVRNIVSDVMLDIPYYLTTGYHDKMVAAVVNEANRIYQLWCNNNPGFSRHGRVHLIAHSLGSVMAVDILSNQPTHVAFDKDISQMSMDEMPQTHFAFDVHDLFVAGSPAGLFLLLKRAGLKPRRGRSKAGSEEYAGEGDDLPGVVGECGEYGCLPVANLYNIVNPYDPVAYCLNAAVDADYSAALKQAWVPSASRSWLSFSAFRSTSTTAADAKILALQPSASSSQLIKQPAPGLLSAMTARLPSNVEMETHNFTREEIAERKVNLLNDNGQIDYFLKYGGGPLEIQYLTMLGAHSSYWLSADFIRMVVTEIGRPEGRNGCLLSMRAQKKKKMVV